MEFHEEIEDDIFVGRGFLDDGKKTGTWYYFYETGELKQEIEYENGVEHGSFKLFHENGNIAIESTRLNGETVGTWKEYYENGNPQEVIEYVDGKTTVLNFWDEDGTHLLKNKTGKRIIKYGGAFNDIWEQYFDNGQFVREMKVSGGVFLGFTSRDPDEGNHF